MDDYRVKVNKFLSGVAPLVLKSKKSDLVIQRFARHALMKEYNIKYEFQCENHLYEEKYKQKAENFFIAIQQTNYQRYQINEKLNFYLKLNWGDLPEDVQDMIEPSWKNSNKKDLSWEIALLATESFDWGEKFPENIKKVIQKGMFATFQGLEKKIPNHRYSLFIKAFIKHLIPYAYSSTISRNGREALITLQECQAFWDELRIILEINYQYPSVIIKEERQFMAHVKAGKDPFNSKGSELFNMSEITKEQIEDNKKESNYLMSQMEDLFIPDQAIEKTAKVLVKNWLSKEAR